MTTRDQQTKLVTQFCEALNELPNVKNEKPKIFPPGGVFGSVAKINARLGMIDANIIVIIRTVIDRSVAENLVPYGKTLSKKLSNSYSVVNLVIFTANVITPEARDFISSCGFGFYDPTSLLIQGQLIYIFREPRGKAPTSLPYERIFSGRRSNVVEYLLSKPYDWFGVNAVAKAVNVAASTTATAIKDLEQIGHLISTGSGPNKKRRVKDPALLLEQWIENSEKPKKIRYLRYRLNPHQDIKSFCLTVATVFDHYNVEYALTSLSAVQYHGLIIAEPSRVEFRVKDSINLNLALDHLCPDNQTNVDTANITLYVFDDKRDLSIDQKIDHIWISSHLSIYRDLLLSVIPESAIAMKIKRGLLPKIPHEGRS